MMKSIKVAFALVGLAASQAVWAYGSGVSTYPLMTGKRLISTEFTGVTSTGGGIGVQGRFTQKISPKIQLDGGLGIAGGERTSRIFAGADMEIFPDYQRQPKVSLRAQLENAKEFDTRQNRISLAPTVSKGFSFWGKEAYPFVSLPYSVSLNSDSKTYETSLNASAGVAGNLPWEGYKHLVGNLEATVGIKDSYTGVFAGVSWPMN